MPRGLLTNQVGYDSRYPIRWVFRAEGRTALPDQSVWGLRSMDSSCTLQGNWIYWGLLWGEHWWTAGLQEPAPDGEYELSCVDGGGKLWRAVIEIQRGVYFHKTAKPVGIDQFERRALIPTVPGNGWIDCGGNLSEANSHAVAVIGMVMLYRRRADAMGADEKERLLQQIRLGCRYFLFLAIEARTCGMPAGTFRHEPSRPPLWLLQDCMQVGIALCMAADLLNSGEDAQLRRAMIEQAGATYALLSGDREDLLAKLHQQLPICPPDGAVQLRQFSPRAHALPDTQELPQVWMTRELLLLLQFQLVLAPHAGFGLEQESVPVLEQILSCWHERADGLREGDNGGPDCWFTALPGTGQPEVAWGHHSFGRDTGGVFPHWIIPLWQWAEALPTHRMADTCRTVVERFITGYLMKAVQANPFGLLPNTWKPGEGWIHFAGLWHGMNASYALMAMQCFYLADKLPRHRRQLEQIAKAQLDWIAGLNAGITKSSVRLGCFMFEADIAEDEAVACSMIHGVGHRYAGSWRNIRGSICNGLSAGRQFHFDVEPRVDLDRPDSFTDEDWITHAGAWLAALAYSDL